MRASILFYISGHGYGHARRMTQVIRELISLSAGFKMHIRSAAPGRAFEPLPSAWIETCDIDAGLVETDPFTIDREKSLGRLIDFMARRDSIVADEVAAVRRLKPQLIVADIPFLAGNVAAETGVPCVGISNFTWDWIYEKLFSDNPAYAPLGRAIGDSYSKISALLELPFGQTCPAIRQKIVSPLIALNSPRNSADILAQIGIAAGDCRPRVLIGTRGSLAPSILAKAAADAREFLFLCPHESATSMPENGLAVQLGPGLDFSDALKISDVVVSKLGYGMISECISSQTRLVWPPRQGFAEDDIVAAEAPKFVPMLPMPHEAYQLGQWAAYLRQALALPSTRQRLISNGAQFCAAFINARCW